MAINRMQAILDAAAKAETAEEAASAAEPMAPAPAAPARPRAARREAADAKFHRPVREGKRFIGGHFEPAVAKQLRMIAAEDDTTIQALLEEAVDLLFAKKGKAKSRALLK